MRSGREREQIGIEIEEIERRERGGGGREKEREREAGREERVQRAGGSIVACRRGANDSTKHQNRN